MGNGPPAVSESEQDRRATERLGATLLEKWRLDAVLGVGGMATVYAATHRNGKRVAIKLLHPELAVYDEVRQRFLAEGYAANNIPHPGVVSVLDDGETSDGCVFLVMELVEGEALDSIIRNEGPLPIHRVLDIAEAVLDILTAAHARGIVHRDVKPGNLIVGPGGQVRLLDFGIASAVEGSRPRTTRAGTPMGTPSFMPPEQARGKWELVDQRADVFAVGATMYNALTGCFLHEGDTPADELVASMTRSAPPLKSKAALTPQIVAAVVDRALSFERDDRFADADAMRQALREARGMLMDASDVVTPPSGVVAPTSSAPARYSSVPSSTPTVRPVANSHLPPEPRVLRRWSVPLAATGLLVAAGVAIALRVTTPGGDIEPSEFAGSAQAASSAPQAVATDPTKNERAADSEEPSEEPTGLSEGESQPDAPSVPKRASQPRRPSMAEAPVRQDDTPLVAEPNPTYERNDPRVASPAKEPGEAEQSQPSQQPTTADPNPSEAEAIDPLSRRK